MYPHQEAAVNEILYEVEVEGKKNIILEAATGFGKSLVISKLAENLDGGVLILTNITALIDQIAEHLDEVGLDYSILKAGYEDKFDPNKRIQLVMSQTFYARRDSTKLLKTYAVIQDECHKEWNTQRTKTLLNALKPEVRIGLSATPFDENGYALEGCDSIVRTTSIPELEKNNYLTPAKYYIPKWSENIDYSELRLSGADYSGAAIDELINTDNYAQMVVQSMNQMNAKDKKTVVFANSIEHAETISKALEEDGYSVYCYHSENNAREAQEALLSFKEGQCIGEGLFDASTPLKMTIKTIVSVSKITTGFDVKDIELLVLCRPTKVLSLYRQIVGRGIRVFPGKNHVEVLDLAGLVSNHGFHFEPYYPPKKGDKKALLQAKQELEAPIVGSIVGEEPTEVSRELIVKKVEEIKQKEKQIPQLETKVLADMFEITNDMKTIIWIGFEMAKRVNGHPYKPSTISWALEPWKEMLEEFPQYERRLIKTCKTRIKNIVKNLNPNTHIKYGLL
jgi:superfamily II DNA or RNA helicase